SSLKLHSRRRIVVDNTLEPRPLFSRGWRSIYRARWLTVGSQVLMQAILLTATLQRANAEDLNAEVRASVAKALFDAAATTAAEKRQTDERFSRQRREIETLESKLISMTKQRQASQEERSRLMAELAAMQEKYVGDLANRDREYKQELAVFRNAVQDIASTP